MDDDVNDVDLRSSSSKTRTPWGHVRASPTGSCLVNSSDTADADNKWHQWRRDNFQPLEFPKEGFDHIYGQDVIQQVDSCPLGTNNRKKLGVLDKMGLLTMQDNVEEEKKDMTDGHDYGSTKTTGTETVLSFVRFFFCLSL